MNWGGEGDYGSAGVGGESQEVCPPVRETGFGFAERAARAAHLWTVDPVFNRRGGQLSSSMCCAVKSRLGCQTQHRDRGGRRILLLDGVQYRREPANKETVRSAAHGG